jgi:hypothetical protein
LPKGTKYGVEEVPTVYKKQLIAAEMEKRQKAKERQAKGAGVAFEKVPPKPRGLTGSTATAACNDEPSPSHSTSSGFHYPVVPAQPWGGAPYGGPIILNGNVLDSPMKRALGLVSPGAPSRPHDLGDTLLDSWLEGLDEKTGNGKTTYGDLWPLLEGQGYEIVRDLVIAPIERLTRDIGGNEVLGRRLQDKATRFAGR